MLIRLHADVHDNEEKKYYWNDLIPDWNLDVNTEHYFVQLIRKFQLISIMR